MASILYDNQRIGGSGGGSRFLLPCVFERVRARTAEARCHGSHARREEEYPDSIQSILNVIDAEDKTGGASYGSHQVLPFLDVENEV